MFVVLITTFHAIYERSKQPQAQGEDDVQTRSMATEQNELASAQMTSKNTNLVLSQHRCEISETMDQRLACAAGIHALLLEAVVERSKHEQRHNEQD